MSAAAPPAGASSLNNLGDKEKLIEFWRSGLQYIAQGVSAQHAASRYAWTSEIHLGRAKSTSRTEEAARAASVKAAPHKETFESCVRALVDLSPPGLFRQASSNESSLNTRVVALENQMRGLSTALQSLETKLGTFSKNLSQIETTVVASEEQASGAIRRGEESRAALEERIVSLSSRIDASPSPNALATVVKDQDKFLTRVESLDSALRGYVKSSEASFNSFKDKTSQLEKRAAEWENLRPKVNEHSAKLVKAEGKLNELQQNADEVQNKMRTLLALAPEAKALLTVPAQTKRTEEGIQNLKKEYQGVKTEFNSMKATMQAVERKLTDSNNQALTSLTADVTALGPLKRHINALTTLPHVVGQLQKSMSDLAPLQVHTKELALVGTKASDLIGLTYDRGRIDGDINQLQDTVKRLSEGVADAQKETLEVVSSMSGRVTALSSESQVVQGDLAKTKVLVTQLEGSATSALTESRELSAKINGIDAKAKVSNYATEWLKKQLESMQEQMSYLKPLGARVEALLLLSGQIETLMPLGAQFGSLSREVQRLWEESEATEAAMDRLDKLASDLSVTSEDSKQRLGQVEANITQLESDASDIFGKLSQSQSTSSAATLQGEQNQQLLEKTQAQLASLASLEKHADALVSLSQQRDSLVSLVQDFQEFKNQYDSDSISVHSQIKKLETASANLMVPLTKQAAEAKQQLATLTTRSDRLRARLETVEKIEPRVDEVEKGQLGVMTSMNKATKKLADDLKPIQDQLKALESLSGKAQELMSLAQKVKSVEDNATMKINKCNKRVEDFKDSVYLLDQQVTGYTSKAGANQTVLELLEREFNASKDVSDSRHKDVEATLKALAPLRESSEPLLALLKVPPRPPPAFGDAQIAELERASKSLQKEMTNVVKTLTWMDPDLRAVKGQVSQVKALDNRFNELSESVKKTTEPLSPLGDRAPALLALLDKPADPVPLPEPTSTSITPEQVKALADVTTRMDTLEEGVQDLRKVGLKAKDLKPLSDGLGSVAKVIGEIIVPFVEKAEPLLSLKPLVDHVQALPPLVEQVAQLQASAKSLSDRLSAPPVPEPGPASQLRSPLSEPQMSRPASPSNATPLFSPVPEDNTKPQNRLKRKRHLEAMIESLEDQIDGVRAEVEGVADEVRYLVQERAQPKRQRTNETPAQVETQVVQLPDRAALQTSKKIEQDLDMVMATIAKLWTGKGGWPEKLDLLLGQQWAVVEGPDAEHKGAGSAVAALRAEIEVLKVAIEARGSGVSASNPLVVDASHIAGMEALVDQLMGNMTKEQNLFKDQLEARLTKMLKPITSMYKALRQTEEED